MGIMVYSLLWVMQDLYHQPSLGRMFGLSENFSTARSPELGTVSRVLVEQSEESQPTLHM